jgi:hypothetical protein
MIGRAVVDCDDMGCPPRKCDSGIVAGGSGDSGSTGEDSSMRRSEAAQSYFLGLANGVRRSPWTTKTWCLKRKALRCSCWRPLTSGRRLRVWRDAGSDAEGDHRARRRLRAVHDHKGRPGAVYILQGTITDHRNGVATDYGSGIGWPEDRTTTHWLENRGMVSAVEISVDIVSQPSNV